MDSLVSLLLVVLTTTLVQVQSSGTCSHQYPVIPGPPGPPGPPGSPGRDGRDGRDGHDGHDGHDSCNDDKCESVNPGSTILTEGDLNSICDNITAKLLDTIQTLNQTLTDHLLHLESQIGITICNITSANWRRIAYFDTTQGDSCPTGLRTVTSTTTYQTACGRTANPGCTSLQFSPDGNYTNVCGKMRGYQFFTPDAFHTLSNSIDSYYLDGISITHGTPRTHLWSYVGGHPENYRVDTRRRCPCARPDPTDRSGVPSFVGEHFYCESGFSGSYYENRIAWEDPLWDGQGCFAPGNQCCNRYGWFHREIPTTSDNIEVRWCADHNRWVEDVFTDQLEIWVM